jgi:hypothetical protein
MVWRQAPIVNDVSFHVRPAASIDLETYRPFSTGVSFRRRMLFVGTVRFPAPFWVAAEASDAPGR